MASICGVELEEGRLIIHILRGQPANREQILDMLQANRFYIKTVVDIRRQILAGGGVMHFDCEMALLEEGSRQEDLWGASWNPISQEIIYESMVNLRPRQNQSMQILSPDIRKSVQTIIHQLLGAA
jgi:Protein of unknown function (DUF5674)